MLLDLENNIWSTGINESGELGLGDSNYRNIFTQIPGMKGKFIAAGPRHGLIIDLNNNVWLFGSNDQNQLGFPATQNTYNAVLTPELLPNIKAKKRTCGDGNTFVIDLNNNIWFFGYDPMGKSGTNIYKTDTPIMIGLKAKQITTGKYHTLLISDYHTLNQIYPFM